jgi:hypothetical protein
VSNDISLYRNSNKHAMHSRRGRSPPAIYLFAMSAYIHNKLHTIRKKINGTKNVGIQVNSHCLP